MSVKNINLSYVENLTPKEIVNKLDEHIVGQDSAKRAVAIALRNRTRRMQVSKELRNEITPKNILMIGPTGVGKTEIARRLASIAKAPFLKIEATKFTEVGYVGRDVDSIIRDLTDSSYKMVKLEEMEKVQDKAFNAAVERIVNVLLPKSTDNPSSLDAEKKVAEEKEVSSESSSITRKIFRDKVLDGTLDDKEIEIDVSSNSVGVEIMAPPGMEEMTSQLQSMFQNLSSSKTRRKKLKIADAKRILQTEEASKLLNEEQIKQQAVERVEQSGIVFLDEIDKVTQRSERSSGADVSREGVQRDLLPLIEGTTVNTKYGPVKTDHILFIASGAFHHSKPSDLIAELQGRLPIRVEMQSLKVEDFEKILTQPKASLIKQYIALFETEGVNLEFTKDAITKIAEISCHVNERTENIGARRLHTVLERILEDYSFIASDAPNQKFVINGEYVTAQLGNLVQNEDMSRFIL